MNRALAHLLTPSLAQPFTQSVSGLWKNFKTDGKMSSKGGFDTDGDHRSKPRLQLKTKHDAHRGHHGPGGTRGYDYVFDDADDDKGRETKRNRRR